MTVARDTRLRLCHPEWQGTFPTLTMTVAPGRPVEAWYASYALAGVTAAGLSPILVPLLVSHAATATAVGLVMAALNLGGLAGPLAGTLADRYRAHRAVLVAGLIGLAAALAAFAAARSVAAWLALAFVQGAGTASAATVFTLLVVERHPRGEWDRRIGWLQTYYGAGQVVGLILAGTLGGTVAFALDLAAVIAAGAALLALATLPAAVPVPAEAHATDQRASGARTGAPPHPAMQPLPGGAPTHPIRSVAFHAGSAQGHTHHVVLAGLRRLLAAERSPFGLFLVGWFISFGGAAGVFSLYPVLMTAAYHVPTDRSSLAFALAAGIGLLLYTPAARWSARAGAPLVLREGLALRVAALIGLAALAAVAGPAAGWFALAAFGAIVLAWSLLSVSGTVMTAELAPMEEGPAMGLFNATTSLGAVAGSIVAGVVAARWGYAMVPLIGAVAVAVGLVMSVTIRGDARDRARA